MVHGAAWQEALIWTSVDQGWFNHFCLLCNCNQFIFNDTYVVSFSPYQLSITFVFPLLAGLAFIYPSFASAPFTGWDIYLKRTFEIFLGHLIGEFIVTSSRFPRCTFRFSLNLIHLIWVMVCYSVIISSETNALLGVIGMLAYYCNFHVYLHSMLKNCDNKLCFINLVAWLFAIALFGILTPIILSVYVHLHIQPIVESHAFHFVVYIVGIVYMVGLCLVQIRVIVLAMGSSESWQDRTSSYPEIKTDTNYLFKEQMTSHYGVYQSLIAIANRDKGYGSVPSQVKKPSDQKLVLPL